MTILFRKWRRLPVVIALAATTFAAHAVVQVKTLGGGPNQSGLSRSGSANGPTLNYAKYNTPSALALDSDGNLYVADRGNNKIRKITKPAAGDSVTSTFASRLPAPVGVAVDASNNVYVVTQGDGKLRKFSSKGVLLQTSPGLVSPTGIALGTDGDAYVTEVSG